MTTILLDTDNVCATLLLCVISTVQYHEEFFHRKSHVTIIQYFFHQQYHMKTTFTVSYVTL